MITTFINQLPTDMLTEDTSFKVFLFFVIVVLLIAIGFLYRKVDNLQEMITKLQNNHKDDLIEMLQKSIESNSSIKELIMHTSITDKATILKAIEEHDRSIFTKMQEIVLKKA
ncbi:hypothetical protein AAU57_11930 [Nonlabens sp. YIK11]|nr:hypothetical protein AAU57_11930 [Nonlabens sp. YIK11]